MNYELQLSIDSGSLQTEQSTRNTGVINPQLRRQWLDNSTIVQLQQMQWCLVLDVVCVVVQIVWLSHRRQCASNVTKSL